MNNKHRNQPQPPIAKVLLIDDDNAFRYSLTASLKKFGFNIVSASSIDEARRLLEQDKYQVIITDINLGPDSPTGDAFLLRNEKLTEGAAKVAITGHGVDRILWQSELRKRGIQIFEKGSGLLQNLKQVILEANQSSSGDETQKFPEQELVALALFGKTVKLVSLTPDGNYHFLDEGQNLHNIIYIAPSETLALQTSIEELESLINDPQAKEKDFQTFFERNPDFILNDEYKKAHPHIVLMKEDGDSLVPDFVLEPIDQNALSDLLELKLPELCLKVVYERMK